jgi:N-acetylmuramic acid 6-phosphate (MurNAc-6-P) etherase
VAVLVARTGVSAGEARGALRRAGGSLREALAMTGRGRGIQAR